MRGQKVVGGCFMEEVDVGGAEPSPRSMTSDVKDGMDGGVAGGSVEETAKETSGEEVASEKAGGVTDLIPAAKEQDGRGDSALSERTEVGTAMDGKSENGDEFAQESGMEDEAGDEPASEPAAGEQPASEAPLVKEEVEEKERSCEQEQVTDAKVVNERTGDKEEEHPERMETKDVEESEVPSTAPETPLLDPAVHDQMSTNEPRMEAIDLQSTAVEKMEDPEMVVVEETVSLEESTVQSSDTRRLSSRFDEFAELIKPFLGRLVKQSTGKKYTELRRASRDALAAMSGESPDEPNVMSRVSEVLKMGCVGGKGSGELSIDCIQRLIEAGFLGKVPNGFSTAVDGCSQPEFDKLLTAVCQASESRDESLYARIIRVLVAAVEKTEIGVHQTALLAVVRTMYHVYLNASSTPVKQAARQALEKVTETVFTKMEEDTQQSAAGPEPGLPRSKTQLSDSRGLEDDEREEIGGNVSFKDAYLLFRALCKLSSKEVPKSSSADQIAAKWKLLALELVKTVLQNSGYRFRTEPKFIFALRNYLAPSLLSNAMSDSNAVVSISLDTFELLVVSKTFRPILKKEIATIFQTVIFRFLESPTAGYARRKVTLDTLATVCADPQTLTDLFLNYDCDMDSIHVFELTINALCSAAQDGISVHTGAVEDGVLGGRAGELRTAALHALVLAVKSMRAWCSPLEAHGSNDAESTIDFDKFVGDAPEEASSGGGGGGGAQEAGAQPAGFAYRDGHDADTDRFQETLRKKKILEKGIMRFNEKPKRGVEYLSSHGALETTPESIANFLRGTEGLDATVVGEYLGEGDDFNVQVMKIYTTSFSFKGVSFEQAMRIFLSGEAQKIARIMEAFAEHYNGGNKDVFASADTAYVLAYSVIMLNTDAHNPQVKKKMSKEEFIRNNRGINDGKDLAADFLEGIYDRIVKNEIRLSGAIRDKASDAVNGRDGPERLSRQNLQNMDPRLRAELFKKESERVLSHTRSEFHKRKKAGIEEIVYYTATNVHIVRLMLENIWCPVLAAISVLLEGAGPTEVQVVDACLEGFRNSIAVVSVFGMDMEKDAFVSSLAKFTLLNSIAEMQKKNVECIRMLLVIAASEGSTLGSQWTWMIRAVVQLEQMRAVATGAPNKYSFKKELQANGERASGNIAVDANAVLVAHVIKDSEIEQIYSNSPSLSLQGITDLCSALCKVSVEELRASPPITYCLQKLVDVVLYNVDSRSNKQWLKIWEVLSSYFSVALSDKNKEVCFYALDSLKQLVWKFLEADEQRHIEVQQLLMKPFEVCFSRTPFPKLQEAVLNCLSQVALARAANIKSGWKPVFIVLALAADDKSEDIMNYGFQICDTIVRKYLGVLDDIFAESIPGIAAYVRTPLSSAVALAAVDHLSMRFAVLLSEGRAGADARPVPVETENGTEMLFTEYTDAHIQTWFPLLIGMSSGITSPLASVRASATNALFRVLKQNGVHFSSGLWTLIYRGVLAPIFDDVRHLSESNSGSSTSWAMSTGTSAMRQLISAVLMNSRTRHLLPDVLSLLSSWIVQSSEAVAREGVMVFTFLITAGGPTFTESDWELLIECFGSFFRDTMPIEIMGPAKGSEVAEADSTSVEKAKKEASNLVDFRIVRSKCVVQLLLAQAVQDTIVMNYEALTAKQIVMLSGFLEESYLFARDFNGNSSLRFALWKAGFMTQVPNLLKQETTGLQAYLRILFWLVADEEKEQADRQAAEVRLFNRSKDFLVKYATDCEALKEKTGRDDARELAARTTIAVFILNNLLHLPDGVFRSVLKNFFPIFVRLLRASEARDVRDAVCDVLEKRISSSILSTEEANDFVPKPQRPSDLRVLVFTVTDPLKSQAIGNKLLDREGVRFVTISEDMTQVSIQGTISITDAYDYINQESPGSKLLTAGSASGSISNRDILVQPEKRVHNTSDESEPRASGSAV